MQTIAALQALFQSKACLSSWEWMTKLQRSINVKFCQHVCTFNTVAKIDVEHVFSSETLTLLHVFSSETKVRTFDM